MANEGVVNDGQAEGTTGAVGATGSSVAAGASGAAGTPHPDTKAWDAERAGFLRDLQAERKARQTHEQQAQQYHAQLEQERRRVQALAGVGPQDPNATENEQIKARLKELGYPQLSQEDLDAMRQWREQSAQFQETTQAMWRDKARVMTSAVEARIAKELGGGDLTPRQVKSIRVAYAQAAEESPEFLSRHEQGDMKLVEEFASQFIEDWFTPIRRRAVQQQVSQFRRVPQGKDRSIPGSSGPKVDVNDPKAVEDMLVSGFKERGGLFGRRSG
jgi:hypothetical protein